MRKQFLLIFGIFLVLEIYVYQGVKSLTQNPFIRGGYVAVNALIYAVIFYLAVIRPDSSKVPFMMNIVMIFIVPKLVMVLFLLVDDILRFGKYLVQAFSAKGSHYPERRKFLGLMALGGTILLSLAVIDGIIFGKYRHILRKVKLKFKNLPKSFKGYKIVQISDVHSGSFSDTSKLQHAIDLINEQKPDLVLFTGDMVNNYAEEFNPFISLFSQIKAKDGKFSVLGNHDYGLYGQWNTSEEQKQNVPKLIDYQRQAGFEMLRNEHRVFERNGDKIYLLGVENWGEPPFPQFGDLDKAVKGVPTDAVKVLMSHDPTHFDAVGKIHPSDIQLTLSGHTHGMQFGLDLKNVKWSPVQYRYKKWIDLYESMGKYLYVNRGFGVIGFHGRVGIYPEITLIELD